MIIIEGNKSHDIIEGHSKVSIKVITLSKEVMVMRGRMKEIVIDDMSSPIPNDSTEAHNPGLIFNQIISSIDDSRNLDPIDTFKYSGILFDQLPSLQGTVGSKISIDNDIITFGWNYHDWKGGYSSNVRFKMYGIKVNDIRYPMFEDFWKRYPEELPIVKVKGEQADEYIRDLIALVQPIITLKTRVQDIQSVIKKSIERRKVRSKLGSLYKDIEVKFFDGENSLEWDGMDEGLSFEEAIVKVINR